jgi:hypothetical protein
MFLRFMVSFVSIYEANVIFVWDDGFFFSYDPTITYYWTVPLISDHSYLVGNLTNSKIAETKALEPLKS